MEPILDEHHQDLLADLTEHAEAEGQSRLSLLEDQRGLTTVEYIIVLVLIAVVGFGVWQRFGKSVSEKVGGSADAIDTLDTTITETP